MPNRIGRYQVRKLIGEGAMGRVYLGWDPQIGRLVALKTVRTDLRLGPRKQEEYLTRFRREARAAGRLSHPNIVAVYDLGEENQVPWIAMEYVEGKSLKELRKKGLPPLPSNVIWLAQRVSSALSAAHGVGIVHRDVKPANILVGKKGEVKVTDFGIARFADSELTREGVMLGSPSYMSPEQVRGKDVGPASDFFGLAVILYEWLTGRKPFDGKDLASITHKIVYESFPPVTEVRPELPPSIDRFFETAMAKNARERFPDGAAFVAALSTALKEGEQTSSGQRASPTAIAAEPGGEDGGTGAKGNGERFTPQEQTDAGSDWRSSLPPRVEQVFLEIARSSNRTSTQLRSGRIGWWWWVAAVLGLLTLVGLLVQ